MSLFFKQKEPPYIPPPKDHMLVHDTISMSLQKKKHFPEHLVRMFVALCGTLGTLYVMQGFFEFPIQMKPLLTLLFGMTLVLRIIRMISPKIGFGCILCSFAAIPMLLLHYREPAVVGAGAVYRVMRKKILWKNIFPVVNASAGDWTEEQCVQFVFVMMVMALVALLEYSDVLLTHTQSSRSGFWIRFLVTFPFLECGLYFGIETSSIAVFMMILFWIGTIALARRKPRGRAAAAQGISAPLQQTFLTETERRMTTHETGTAFLMITAVLLAWSALHASVKYVRTEEMNERRRELREFYQNLTVEDVTGILQSLPGSFGPNIVSDEVDLLGNSDVHFEGKPVMHLSIGGAAAVDDYYLRGIVRSEYTGRGWGIPTGVYRSNQRLFRKLTAANRMPQTVFHSDSIDSLRNSDGKFPVVRCNVTALNKERVNFLPYQSIFDIGTKYRYDIEIELDDTQEYAFWMMNNAQIDWTYCSQNEAPSPDKLVSDYESFAAEEYVKLPNTAAMQRLSESFAPNIPSYDLPMEQRLAVIRDYIWERAEYTLQPGTQPQDRDFVEYFLTESHKGYCAHYASAAVVLCRISGIPARYCQGYVLTENDFTLGHVEDGYEINVPDDQAHAWAEIYVKGYGWIPFEFTETVVDTWHTPIETEPVETETVTVTTATAAVSTSDSGAGSTDSYTTTTTTATTAASDVTTEPQHGALTPEQLAALWQKVKTVLCIIAVLALYYLLHRLILARRRRSMADADANQAAQAAYLFLIYLLHIQGLDQKKLSHDEFSEKAEAECKLLPKGRIARAIAIQQEAVFSRNGIAQADAKMLFQTAQQLADAMYRDANPLRKLWLRWGRHII